MRRKIKGICGEADIDPFALVDVEHGGRHILIFSGGESRTLLDDGDLAAESAVHLGKLDADVVTTDDDEVLRQDVEGEQAAVGQVWHAVETGRVRNRSATADVDEYLSGFEKVIAD